MFAQTAPSSSIAMENLARYIMQKFGLERAACHDHHMKVLKHWTGFRLKFVFDGHTIHFLTTLGRGPVVIPKAPVAVVLGDGAIVHGTCYSEKDFACSHFRFAPTSNDMLRLLGLVENAITHTTAETLARMQ